MTALTVNQKVLELNKSWVAIKVINVRQAFKKVGKGVAQFVDVAEDYGQYDFETWADLSKLREEYEPEKYSWIKTTSGRILRPLIIRVTTYNQTGKKSVRFCRENIFKRDKNVCQYCLKTFPRSELTLDHVVPKIQGGVTSWNNITSSCVACNSRKGGRTPEQAGMPLHTQPKRPKWNPGFELPPSYPKSWDAFISDAYWSVELEN